MYLFKIEDPFKSVQYLLLTKKFLKIKHISYLRTNLSGKLVYVVYMYNSRLVLITCIFDEFVIFIVCAHWVSDSRVQLSLFSFAKIVNMCLAIRLGALSSVCRARRLECLPFRVVTCSVT